MAFRPPQWCRVGFLLLGLLPWFACDERQAPLVPTPPEVRFPVASPVTLEEPAWAIGPIQGLTTGWHAVPDVVTVPPGLAIKLRCVLAEDAEVSWFGASEIARDQRFSTAECPPHTGARQTVRVEIRHPTNGVESHECMLITTDIPVEHVGVSPIQIADERAFTVDEGAFNGETVEAYFNGSISSLQLLAPGRYRTSVDQLIVLETAVEPAIYASMIEWRVNDVPVAIGSRLLYTINSVGLNTISVGLPTSPETVDVEAYRVRITSHATRRDYVKDGDAVTFRAETEPPGLENQISWLSSTLYGTARPTLGKGGTFKVTFGHTKGSHDGLRWLGVRADNATFEQDVTVPDLITDFTGPDSAKADNAYLYLISRGKEAIPELLGLQSQVQDYAGAGFYDARSSIFRVDPAPVALMALYVIEAIYYYGNPTPYHAPILLSELGTDPTLSEAYAYYQSWWSNVEDLTLDEIRLQPAPLTGTSLFWAGGVMLAAGAGDGTGTQEGGSETPPKTGEGGKVTWEQSLDGPDAGADPDPYNCVLTPKNAGGSTPYNCLAWAIACLTDRAMQPKDKAGEHWDQILADYGYNTTPVACAGQCPAGKGPKLKMIWQYPAGKTKNDGNWVHAMKQEADGDWTSKNGFGPRFKDITNCTAFLDKHYPKGDDTREVLCFCKN